MRDWMLMLIAGLAAAVIPFQAVVNGRLGRALEHPLYAAFFSFLGGTIALTILVLATTPGIPSWPKENPTPWFYFIGGLLGVVFVTTILIVTPQIGPANVLAATVVGQLTMAIIIDHFGILGVPIIPVSLPRLLGVLMLFGGLLLIQTR
ncbi:hypothetical protein Pan54_41830 [Rubinisphaera italica]|uniref:DMT family transporter n=1 Tax=Rubinisphaera italica TaxID=2527969 RepID=A0A5C5XKH0_9PLAN|nr:hypothetical protein Pan54_41830 [Rubinisphaera italica]